MCKFWPTLSQSDYLPAKPPQGNSNLNKSKDGLPQDGIWLSECKREIGIMCNSGEIKIDKSCWQMKISRTGVQDCHTVPRHLKIQSICIVGPCPGSFYECSQAINLLTVPLGMLWKWSRIEDHVVCIIYWDKSNDMHSLLLLHFYELCICSLVHVQVVFSLS